MDESQLTFRVGLMVSYPKVKISLPKQQSSAQPHQQPGRQQINKYGLSAWMMTPVNQTPTNKRNLHLLFTG